ncbi:hypothetical protein BC828DRAFT_388856 [Blastocladiella britannica]|nr:hypothetical protein BC828DRAFT_388856 [Blastocladiella britannica]
MSRSVRNVRPRCVLFSFVFLSIWAGPSQLPLKYIGCIGIKNKTKKGQWSFVSSSTACMKMRLMTWTLSSA